jgi:hypothetical protein
MGNWRARGVGSESREKDAGKRVVWAYGAFVGVVGGAKLAMGSQRWML